MSFVTITSYRNLYGNDGGRWENPSIFSEVWYSRVIPNLVAVVIFKSILHSDLGWIATTNKRGTFLWWDIFSLVYIDEEIIPTDSLPLKKPRCCHSIWGSNITVPVTIKKVYAVYGRDRRLLLVLVPLLALGVVGSALLMCIEIPPGQYSCVMRKV
ncbi:hypothetical protein BU17DRAFT_62244 [Hysterangium stoloniferum]|nr:hypothetical protein BU17DRAFT_62244 [Hysterangium stoloniferum]